ncbi:hypothetical protein FVR03_19725 [Pontibacter qinzhouensis]|uniref:Uncharacterized protein n=1 Tax=Pontibacter qinzhouensis TaxID=2603253 RepID=A0A5C8J5W4_9BACT|nr:hypothetical protein [Pontibacter qinzhouensis]TXK31564.1 hypothetical protein FVR03_19725 [Pontibacter qinzhouensis]
MENTQNKGSQVKSQQDVLSTSQISEMWNKSGLKDIPGRLQKFGSTAVDKVSHLSTTQKVVGGTLLALGAGWVTMSNTKQGKNLLSKMQNRTLTGKKKY